MVKASKRVTIWLGDDDEPVQGFEVHSEDAMVAIEGIMDDGTEIEVFIGPGLFGRVREVMDGLEGRGQ